MYDGAEENPTFVSYDCHNGLFSHHCALFAAADHKPWNVKYPLLTQLKNELRQLGSDKKVSKWQREEISILALDLFRYAQQVKQGTEQPDPEVQSEGAPSD